MIQIPSSDTKLNYLMHMIYLPAVYMIASMVLAPTNTHFVMGCSVRRIW